MNGLRVFDFELFLEMFYGLMIKQSIFVFIFIMKMVLRAFLI